MSTHIADTGAEVPLFVAERTFDAESEDWIHKVTLADPLADVKSGETETVIKMIVDIDGGIVWYDDGEAIYRRVFDDEEETIDVFKTTVSEAMSDYDRRGVEYEFEYKPGAEPIDIDN